MIPQVDIQRNAETQRRLEKAFQQNMDDATIYQKIDRAIGELPPKHYGIETVYQWMFLIIGLSVGLIILLCAAGVGLGLFRVILRHVN